MSSIAQGLVIDAYKALVNDSSDQNDSTSRQKKAHLFVSKLT
jgi:hypothetical protein